MEDHGQGRLRVREPGRLDRHRLAREHRWALTVVLVGCPDDVGLGEPGQEHRDIALPNPVVVAEGSQ